MLMIVIVKFSSFELFVSDVVSIIDVDVVEDEVVDEDVVVVEVVVVEVVDVDVIVVDVVVVDVVVVEVVVDVVVVVVVVVDVVVVTFCMSVLSVLQRSLLHLMILTVASPCKIICWSSGPSGQFKSPILQHCRIKVSLAIKKLY